MANVAARALIGQLTEDLGWLEQHCRRLPEHARTAGQLRLAAALVRNCLGPMLDQRTPVPLHLVVVGGAGAGKSTVANLLSGAHAAEANPQAGFTRHPIAYTSATGPADWTGHVGFLGPLQYLSEPAPSSLDRDVYQVRRVPHDPSSYDLLKDYVVWDCPDMTTWAAAGYIPRLIEAAALADVIVYVASDERYNDEAPTQFLQMLLEAGKPVVAVLCKMREADAAALVAHFRREVLAPLPPGVVGCLAIPYLKPAELADPARLASRYRIPLINQVAVLGSQPREARRRSAMGALRFLTQHQEQFLSVARNDLVALQRWRTTVLAGRTEFENRYQREYLSGERFHSFDEALVRLLQLLELPGVGRVLSGALYVLRTPYRLVAGMVGKAMARPAAAGRAELTVLDEALTGWLDLLRKEAARQVDTHPLWNHVAQGFQGGGLADLARERFAVGYRNFQFGVNNEIDRTAHAIFEELQKNPWRLNVLRGSKFALDVGSIGATVALGGLSWWDVVLVPLVASVTNQLVELLGRGWVDTAREQTRQRQQALLVENLAAPLADWLIQWPVTGGSSFERLQLALRRIPEGIRQLYEEVARIEAAQAPPAPLAIPVAR